MPSISPTSARWLQRVQLLLRLGLAGLFAYAGVLKLADPVGFAGDLAHYRVLPEPLVAPLAVAVPMLEVVTAVGLLWSAYAQGAAALCALMLLTFAVAMAQTKLRGINLDCGCFGAGSEAQVSWGKVTLDVGLAMLALWLMRPIREIRSSLAAPRGS